MAFAQRKNSLTGAATSGPPNGINTHSWETKNGTILTDATNAIHAIAATKAITVLNRIA